jgi:hypothetical protein
MAFPDKFRLESVWLVINISATASAPSTMMSPPVEHPEKLLKSKLTRLIFALSALHITFAPSGARSLEARFRYVMDLGGKRKRIEKPHVQMKVTGKRTGLALKLQGRGATPH